MKPIEKPRWWQVSLGNSGGWTYNVCLVPAGYEAVSPAVGIEIPMVFGQPTARHVFRFRKVARAGSANEK